MALRVPVGTEVVPCSAKTGAIGVSRLTTIEVTLKSDDEFESLGIQEDGTADPVKFYRVSLPPNESDFDGYLVRQDDCVEMPD
jgi:hypothetical protein